jgi:branched-chain amino acid transport system permease protein
LTAATNQVTRCGAQKGSRPVLFFSQLVIEGMLAGAVYALIALAFVIVYKAFRLINFAIGEWLMLGSLLVAASLNALGLDLAAAIMCACLGMFVTGWLFSQLVLRHLIGRAAIASLMVMLGVGALLRGLVDLTVRGAPWAAWLPVPAESLAVMGLIVPSDKLVAAFVSIVVIGSVAWFYHRSRAGVALRAVADDPQMAMAVGININRQLLIVWCLTGAICVVAGTLWTAVGGGKFGAALIGVKIFPIVIIGGLDSIAGTMIAAVLIGLLESLATGYLDPHLGGGSGLLLSSLALIAMLLVRPYGLFGRPRAQRV